MKRSDSNPTTREGEDMITVTQKAINQLERVCDLLFNHPQRDENDEAAIDLIQTRIAEVLSR